MALEVSLVEGGIARLQSPAGLGFVGGGGPRELGSLWRWGALLLLAALAAYGSLIARVRLLLRRLHCHLCTPTLAQPQQWPYDDDDDDDDTCSSCSEEEEELLSAEEEEGEEDEGVVGRAEYLGDNRTSEGQNGSFDLRGGREVVRAWSSGELRFHDSAALGCVVSLYDSHRGEVVRSFAAGDGPIAAARVASAPPAVVLSAGDSLSCQRVELRLWDARVGGRAPAAFVELSPQLRRRVQRLGGAGKVVYVGDGAGSAAEVDMRRVRSPVGKVAEEEASWWDADAVLVGGGDVAGFFHEGATWSPPTDRFRPRRK